MKKILLSLAIVSMFAVISPALASASTQACGNPSDSTADTTYITCGNGMPIPNQGPVIRMGQSVTDEGGITYAPCDLFGGCVDLTHTDVYRNQMRTIVAQLTANGFLSQFPMLKGWIGK